MKGKRLRHRRRPPCRSGTGTYWQSVLPPDHATTSAAARLRHDHRAQRSGTSSYRYQCRLRQSHSVLSQPWRAPCLGAPGKLIAGQEHGRTIPLADIGASRRSHPDSERFRSVPGPFDPGSVRLHGGKPSCSRRSLFGYSMRSRAPAPIDAGRLRFAPRFPFQSMRASSETRAEMLPFGLPKPGQLNIMDTLCHENDGGFGTD